MEQKQLVIFIYYKDGYRLPDSYIEDLTFKMKGNSTICNGRSYFSTVQMRCDFENEENNRTL